MRTFAAWMRLAALIVLAGAASAALGQVDTLASIKQKNKIVVGVKAD